MKKIILSLLAIVSVMTASAQQKGEMTLGGLLGVGTTSNILHGSSTTSLSFGIAPEFGYFAAKNFRIGATVGYELVYNEGSTHAFTIMPNLAYYVEICDKFYYTPGLEFGFSLAASSGVIMPGFEVGLNLGSFEFRPTKRFGVSVHLLSFSYSLYSYKNEFYNTNSSAVTFNLGLSPSVGIKYYF